MNVVFIGPFGMQPKSTMSRRALPLAKALTNRGHVVTILVPPWDDPLRAGQIWQEAGVRVVNVDLPAGVPLLYQLRLTRTLVIQALALKPDVVHFFKPKAYAGLAHLALWWLRWFKVTAARLVVDADDWEQAWNNQGSYSQAQKRIFAWQEGWGLRHADAVTVASRELKELVGIQRGKKESGIYYAPNGYPTGVAAALDLTAAARQPAGCRAGFGCEPDQAAPDLRRRWQLGQAPVILLYTRFVEFRLDRLVSMVAGVARLLPEARWLIVGRGFQGEEQLLANQLVTAGLVENARFAGWQPVEALPAYFDLADVAVFPCDDTVINRTKCSVKAIDLLAAGLPVVADSVGQNCEYIQNDVSGILVPAEDDAAFAGAVVQLLREPGKRHRLGQAAARRMREVYSWPITDIVDVAHLCCLIQVNVGGPK
jgi:glycosyltransferase involved in cell wall biosynthesis